MKKIFLASIACIAFTTISLAQTAATSAGQGAAQATQTVNAVDMQQSNVKCATTSKACCAHGKTETSTTSTSVTTESTATGSDQCKTVSFGMSAEKPKEQATEEKPKN